MWKEYSFNYIKNNKASSISIVVSVFIAALFLSFLCSLFYNFWQDEIHGIELEEGNWHGRIIGEFKEEEIEFIQNYADVKTAVINKELSDGKEIVVDICFYHIRTTIQNMEDLAEALGLTEEAVTYHFRLLSMYFIRDERDTAPRLLFPAYFCIVFITCISLILIIHNSFAISMNARIQQFGIFSSIGATPSQIRICLLQEAVCLAFFPALLGLLLGITLCYGMISILNHFIRMNAIVGGREAFFEYHPAIFAITCFVCIITILFSAWIPARKLSKLTPLEAIFGIEKIGRKEKSFFGFKKKKKETYILPFLFLRAMPCLHKHLANAARVKYPIACCRVFDFGFGIEGELAGLAVYHQKKAMRTSFLSLTFSFFAFMIMMCFFTLSGISTEQTYFQRYQNAWDIMVTVKNTKIEDFTLGEECRNLKKVRSSTVYQKAAAKVKISKEWRSKELEERNGLHAEKGNDIWLVNASIVIMEDEGFLEYCEQINAEKSLNGTIILNRIWDNVNSDFRHPIYIPYVKEEQKTTILEAVNKRKKGKEEKGKKEEKTRCEIPVLAYTEKPPVLREEYAEYDNFALVHIMPLSIWKNIKGIIGNAEADTYIRVLADRESEEQDIEIEELNKLEQGIRELIGTSYVIESENRLQEKITNNQMIQGMMFVLGAFCVLLAMIGIANVFSNTLSFLHQRKREFARYLSIGMTLGGMKKMFCIEALLIAGKPLIITLPLVIVIVAFMIKASYLDPMIFLAKAPVIPILIFIFAVFAFIALAYYIGGKKIIKCNLIDSLRDDTMI